MGFRTRQDSSGQDSGVAVGAVPGQHLHSIQSELTHCIGACKGAARSGLLWGSEPPEPTKPLPLNHPDFCLACGQWGPESGGRRGITLGEVLILLWADKPGPRGWPNVGLHPPLRRTNTVREMGSLRLCFTAVIPCPCGQWPPRGPVVSPRRAAAPPSCSGLGADPCAVQPVCCHPQGGPASVAC